MSTATTTSEQSQATERLPHVLIAGGGLGGLFLGILLEKAGIPYEIFERSSEIKSIGKYPLLHTLYKAPECRVERHGAQIHPL